MSSQKVFASCWLFSSFLTANLLKFIIQTLQLSLKESDQHEHVLFIFSLVSSNTMYYEIHLYHEIQFHKFFFFYC